MPYLTPKSLPSPDPLPFSPVRYRLTIAYDGTDFHGWQQQFQPVEGAAPDPETGEKPRTELRTVQSVVRAAVRSVIREPVQVQGASRTDSGVHARCQTAAFTTTDDRIGPPDEKLMLAINSRLPEDVLVTSCVRTRDDFDPTSDCVRKGYRYRIFASPVRPLWDRRVVYHLRREVDHEAMDQAAQHLVGTHDFESIASTHHGRESTVRTLHHCSVTRTDDHNLQVDVAGDGFLYNMVRILAGTLVEVGIGKIAPGDIPAILEAKDRRKAGPTLPPEGLCLMWAEYPEPDGVLGDAPEWVRAGAPPAR